SLKACETESTSKVFDIFDWLYLPSCRPAPAEWVPLWRPSRGFGPSKGRSHQSLPLNISKASRKVSHAWAHKAVYGSSVPTRPRPHRPDACPAPGRSGLVEKGTTCPKGPVRINAPDWACGPEPRS